MISSQYGFVYIHYPKTGGTTIQTMLLPFADDHKQVEQHQDGIEQFEVTGPHTPEKHATLQSYWDLLGDGLNRYQITVSVRHPFERFVSAYFSPHKWQKETAPGKWVAVEPYWDEKRMRSLLRIGYQRPATAYLTVNGKIVRPTHVIRHETFARDLANVTRALNLPLGEVPAIPHVNASAVRDDLRAEVLGNAELREEIEEFYRSDMEYFGYESYAGPA